MPRYAARVDRNHQEVCQALVARGWRVFNMSRMGYGFPDLIAVRAGVLRVIEVKDGTKEPRKQRLRPKQVDVHQAFADAGYPVVVVSSLSDLEAL